MGNIKSLKFDNNDSLDKLASYEILRMTKKERCKYTNVASCEKNIVLLLELFTDIASDASRGEAFINAVKNVYNRIDSSTHNPMILNIKPIGMESMKAGAIYNKEIQEQAEKEAQQDLLKTVAKYYVKVAHVFSFVTIILESKFLSNEKLLKKYIHTFEDLYYDADFDKEKNIFLSKSLDAEGHYNEDLTRFCNVLDEYASTHKTHKQKMSERIKNFSSIGLNDFHLRNETINVDKTAIQNMSSKEEYKGVKAHCLAIRIENIKKYIAELRGIMMENDGIKMELMAELNKMFYDAVDSDYPQPDAKVRDAKMINPELTYNELVHILKRIKITLNKHLANYDNRMDEILKMYQLFVEQLMLKTTKGQLKFLESQLHKESVGGQAESTRTSEPIIPAR